MYKIVIHVIEMSGEWDMLCQMLQRTDYAYSMVVDNRAQKLEFTGLDLELFISYLVMHRIRFEVQDYVLVEHPDDESGHA